jgi:hypothetical protein
VILEVCDLKVIKAYVELKEELKKFKKSFDRNAIVNM